MCSKGGEKHSETREGKNKKKPDLTRGGNSNDIAQRSLI